MSEWWTYSLSDFLLFSASTYRRLFELYNLQVWPLHLLGLALGAGLAALLWRGGSRHWQLACVGLAAAWAWVAWAFFAQHYSTINWAASIVAAAFAVQAGLLLGSAAVRSPTPADHPRTARHAAAALIGFALLVQPLIGPLLGRPWRQAEVFGMVPDPTVTLTLGMLVLAPRRGITALLWPVPLLWSALDAATLSAMNSPDAALMPVVAAVAVAAAAWQRPSR